jgi:hypothetical protein
LPAQSQCGYFVAMKASYGTLEIRSAIRDDATEIVRVRREAILAKAAAHYDRAILNDWADAMPIEDRVARIAQRISDPGIIVLVAAAGGEIVGFAMADLSGNELQALYTRPNQVGSVGRTLLAALENLAFETVQFLRCDASVNAAKFYKANGYIEECRKDYVSSPGGIISRVVQMRKHCPLDRSSA